MTREEREKAIRVLDSMKVKIDIPKVAVMQNDKNWALDMAIKALEEPKTGHWIDDWLNEYKSCPIVICSNCGKGGFTAYKEFNYCPQCGCRMSEVSE